MPEPVAAAVIELLTGALLENPQRVGRELRRELAGVWSARRGTYRVLYRINEERQEVIVERIEHHSQSYRRR
jgi:mRNA-degrading endonuclease RelE of RelBE toxin-antitoxin system